MTHTDLPQLDTGPVLSNKILDEFAKIDSSRRSKIKNHLAAIKKDFHVHQLHAELMLCNALATILEGIPGKSFIFFHGLHVLVVGKTINRLVPFILRFLTFLRSLLDENNMPNPMP